MAQTKRKRRTKHRGNAAGSVEARGRTGRKPTAAEQKKARREERLTRPPSWNSAFMRAGLAALLLFLLLQFGLGPDVPFSSKIFLCAFAMLIYVPLGYATDKFVYNRRMRAKQQPKH